MNRSFQYWKELVGLENTDFPQLIDLTDDTIDRATIVSTRLSPIKADIAANSLVGIKVQPGWGATTLYRYLKYELCKDSLTLLVDYDFEAEPLDGSLTEADFIFRTKWLMANYICRMFRKKPMQPMYMYEVMDFEDDGSSPWQGHLRRKMQTLNKCEKKPEAFYRQFPFFASHPVDVCVNYFLANFQIRTVFLYLFPQKVASDALYELVGTIKNLYDGKEIQPAAMREVYVCTPKVFRRLTENYERPYHVIEYARYSAAEIFRMLVSTYHIDDSAQSVTDVFTEDFITAAHDPRATLKRIMATVEEDIQQFLPEDTASIPYKLERTERNEEADRV